MRSSTRFPADRATYFRAHMRMAAVCMGGAMGILWLLEDPNIWVGGLAALGAIAIRGWYLHSEEMALCWRLEDGVLIGPATIKVPLPDVEQLRALGSFVQIVTKSGDKHLIKYQADPAATIAAIERAMP